MGQENISLSLLFALTDYKADPKVAFHAAWLFEEIILLDLSQIKPFIFSFLDQFPTVNNRSVRRHFSKILCKLLEANANNQTTKLPESLLEVLRTFNFESIVESLFDWIIDTKEKVGVKVWCMESLYYLSIRYPWISDELEPQISFLGKTGSAAILSRQRKIKKLLKFQ